MYQTILNYQYYFIIILSSYYLDHIDNLAVAKVPENDCEGEVNVIFFKLNCGISFDEMEKICDSTLYKPAGPYIQAAVNEAHPSFADYYRNTTYWKDSEGNRYVSVFSKDVLIVTPYDRKIYNIDFLAVVEKSPSES
ncbi:MAG: hypothetical protein JW740_01865 [Candidatus Zambryskibacteria bacterium]|nr:hypothetical protein [Candidatus Zambryskibacteria bacterium]